MRLEEHLVLADYLTSLLGDDAERLRDSMKDADEGRRPDGQSYFYSTLESRESSLRLSLERLAKFDLNILNYEAQLAQARPELDFRLKYFQYLAALYNELYLYLLTTDRTGLLMKLEAHREDKFPDLPEITLDKLDKLSLWMATGSGKTLLMHLNYHQFLHYKPFEPNNILLITPSDTLSKQHLADFAASGIPAHYFRDPAPLGERAVKVIEITKLLAAGEPRSGGLSVPVTDFAGPNLVLVDEGHKGTQNKSDREDERKWRNIRESLVAGSGDERGFTYEYSATFAQVTEGKTEVSKALFKEYARSILFDYSYARFHADGYGKDFAIINLKEGEGDYSYTVLLAALLTFYEQYRYVKAHPKVVSEYGVETPLMVFVGAYVNAGNEVLDVIKFLDTVLREPEEVTADIGNLLSGQSGLVGPDKQDAFATSFSYLKTLALDTKQLYGELAEALFYGTGGIGLHRIKNAEGEIGLRALTSDTYCGLIYVGDTSKFANKIQNETQLEVSQDEHLSEPLFKTINDADSTLNFLIGSKKFTEGWSSYRVSTMGLIKVGNNAGAQVLQLFGRGVRLRGKETSLRRSEVLQGPHPDHLPLAETLSIFGLNANYLKKFLDMLRKEGVEPPVSRLLEIDIDEALLKAKLSSLELRPDYDFMRETRTFNPTAISDISLAVSPTLEIASMEGATSTTAKPEAQRLSDKTLAVIPVEALYQHALAYKGKKGWTNLFISRHGLLAFLAKRAKLAVAPEVLEPQAPTDLARLTAACQSLVEKGLDSYYLNEQRRAESQQLRLVTVTQDHANFPSVKDKPAYTLKIPKDLLAEVEALIADTGKLETETLAEPLPRLYLQKHLYAPLLVKSSRGSDGVKSTPTGLEESEVKFLKDLRAFWAEHYAQAEWRDYDIFIMRNLPKKGIGFFQTAGFYPDFLLWLKRGDDQALAFIDPKGLVQWDEEKVMLLKVIGELSDEVGLPLSGFIVTPTELSKIPVQNLPLDASQEDKQAHLESRNVFVQDGGDYIPKVLRYVRAQLEGVPA